MLKLYVWLTDKIRSERGQDMVEYALITAVISIAIIVAVIAILGPAFETWALAVEDCIATPSACVTF